MNAKPAHLDLEDLIARVTGQPVGGQAREHLADCGQCQLEAERWSRVAEGVRDLMADMAGVSRPARPSRTSRRVLAGRWRRAMVVAGSAAAALVLLMAIGVAAGLVHVRLSRPRAETALTSVSGCARLEQATGTLVRVNGAAAIIKTASGQLVTATATASTRLAASGALLADIRDGAAVTVAGTRSGGMMTADYVVVSAKAPPLTIPGIVIVRGTVTDAGAAGFTVVTSAGTRVPVTTSGGTIVTVFRASMGQLQAGARTMAIGYAGRDGTLSALAVLQPPNWPAGAHATLSVRNCSATAINHAIMTLATAGRP